MVQLTDPPRRAAGVNGRRPDTDRHDHRLEVDEKFGAPECVVGAAYPAEPVPMDVEVGPDGSYYVSSLPGFPKARGTGSVFRVMRSGSVGLVATGFSGAVDLAVSDDGTIYVAEPFGGQISQIVDGDASVLVYVTEPAAVEVALDGTLYATADAFGNGRVVIVTPDCLGEQHHC